ncbi:MAG: type II toxin-antitoxin system VapC family toxin [Ignavibacteriales bacterium]|nr:type II toxin-antitoxin system VapC family toxin [Ignavibacteriales bacterium]
MKYLLDTTFCVYLINRKPGKVIARLKSIPAESVGISIIAVAEIFYGCHESDEAYRQTNLQALHLFLTPFSTVPFDERDAEQFGKLKAILQSRGDTLADLDIAIASQAASRGLILVTNDVRHFKRVPGLKVMNWVK